jgi:phosphoribosyl 1,2-cyclic phosphodiesterase
MLTIDVLASGSSGNAYLVSDGVSNILLDAGISLEKIHKRSGFKRIDIALISHKHLDHSKAIPELLKSGTPTFMPISMAREIKNHNAYSADGTTYTPHINEGDFVIKEFELQHDVPTLGYALYHLTLDKTIVYITDSAYTKYKFNNVTHWLLECNHARDILDENVASGTLNQSLRNRIVQNHMNIDTAKDILRVNDLSKTEAIYLLHLSNDNSDAERFKREVQELTGKAVYTY